MTHVKFPIRLGRYASLPHATPQEATLRTATMHGPGESPTLSQRFKHAVFGTFHSMRERDSKQRVTVAGQVWMVTLLLIDFIQVAVLAANPAFGWSPGMVSWLTEFSLLDVLLPERQPGSWRVAVLPVAVLLRVLTPVTLLFCRAVQRGVCDRVGDSPWRHRGCCMYVCVGSASSGPFVKRVGGSSQSATAQLPQTSPTCFPTPTSGTCGR